MVESEGGGLLGNLRGVAIATALVSTLIVAPNAGAATEVGNECLGTGGVGGATVVPISVDPDANVLPLTVPSAGVAVRWTMRTDTNIGTLRERLKVFRSTTLATQFKVVGESAEQSVVDGLNVFSTRIPVEAGDRFGLYGPPPSGGILCTGTLEDTAGYVMDDVPVGSTTIFNVLGARVGVSVSVEPDADGDGFGDETQDDCTRSAAVQVDCPPLKLDAVARPAARGSITILVATSTEAPVAVSATARLRGAKAALSAPQQTVAAGAITGFKLKFTKALRRALAGMPKSKSLKLNVSAEGTDRAGVLASDHLTVMLRGTRSRRR